MLMRTTVTLMNPWSGGVPEVRTLVASGLVLGVFVMKRHEVLLGRAVLEPENDEEREELRKLACAPKNSRWYGSTSRGGMLSYTFTEDRLFGRRWTATRKRI